MRTCFSKQWRKISTVCGQKVILMLLVWKMLYKFSRLSILSTDSQGTETSNRDIQSILFKVFHVGCFYLSPLVGWLADAKVGRYRMIITGVLLTFIGSIASSVRLLTNINGVAGDVLHYVPVVIEGVGYIALFVTMLPFLTDQLIGATAFDLSALVYWYYWIDYVSSLLSRVLTCTNQPHVITFNHVYVPAVIATVSSASLALIIISDCLCQQWLDRTHKVSNPIKLIFQVLNYARKNSYPRQRSAFTYIDEEHPSRIDFGKDKFGGPFTEEEVEDVKTVLRMIPLVACLSFSTARAWNHSKFEFVTDTYAKCVLRDIFNDVLHLIFVPLYQLVIYPLFHKWLPTMLKRIGIGLFLQLLGYIGCVAVVVYHTYSDDLTDYFTCRTINSTDLASLNWKLAPQLVYTVGKIMASVLLLEFIAAQSPDKMKGLVFGMNMTFVGVCGTLSAVVDSTVGYTVCYHAIGLALNILLLLVFLFLSKCYRLRERNRVVNIQAIAEEHYERYLDQEEEYMRQQPQVQLQKAVYRQL